MNVKYDHISMNKVVVIIKDTLEIFTAIKFDVSSEQKRFVKVEPIKESSPAQNDDDIQIAIPNIVG